jgi:hypothetical protein
LYAPELLAAVFGLPIQAMSSGQSDWSVHIRPVSNQVASETDILGAQRVTTKATTKK